MWFIFGLMASVTFIGLLSELLPSGILLEMTEGLGVEQAEVGFLVGVYALASAVFAIPIISATLWINRKVLLLTLLLGFSVSNLVVGFSSNYSLIVAMRIVGGICAGIMWPMIAAYGSSLVPKDQQGKAITIIMAGNTFGVSLGLPLMTVLGTSFDWRVSFIALGLLSGVIALLSAHYLPVVAGEKLTKENSPLAMLKLPAIQVILLLTFLSVVAHYSTYTYIALLTERIAFWGGISLALLIFGLGSIVSVLLSAYIIDRYLQPLIVGMLLSGALAIGTLSLLGQVQGLSHAAFFLWGLAFGPLVTMYQAAVSKRVAEGKAIATSVQSSMFNLSIMVATWLGGLILVHQPSLGVIGVGYLSLLCFVPATLIAAFAHNTLSSK